MELTLSCADRKRGLINGDKSDAISSSCRQWKMSLSDRTGPLFPCAQPVGFELQGFKRPPPPSLEPRPVHPLVLPLARLAHPRG